MQERPISAWEAFAVAKLAINGGPKAFEEKLGKPLGQDEARERPSSARELGLKGARRRFDELMAGVVEQIPPCPGAEGLKERVIAEARGFLPGRLAADAA